MRCHRAGTSTFAAHRAGYRRTGAAGPRADLEVCSPPIVSPVRNIRPARGVELSRSLLSGWVDACCWLLSPLEEALHGSVMTDGKLHADDTPVQYCCRVIRRRRPGGCGRMFVMTAMPAQRWHLQCGSLTAQTEKASIRRLVLPASAVCCNRMRTPGSTSCIAMVG